MQFGHHRPLPASTARRVHMSASPALSDPVAASASTSSAGGPVKPHLSFWQVANWGSAGYHNYFFKSDSAGLTYAEVGSKATVPLPWVSTSYCRPEAVVVTSGFSLLLARNSAPLRTFSSASFLLLLLE